MLVVLQHPFANLRRFLPDEGTQVRRPLWPLARADVDFLRSSGIVRERVRGGIQDWSTEHHYVDAWRALRFPNAISRNRLASGLQIPFTFRRYHSDGPTARLDIGLELRGDSRNPIAALSDIADIPVFIGRQRKQSTLIGAGRILAEHFLFATTVRRVVSKAQEWWLSAGAPAVILEYATGEIDLPAQAHTLINVDGASVAHLAVKLRQFRCNVWFIQRGPGSADATRRIRLHLSCLHTECESLRLLLDALSDPNKLPIRRGGINAELAESHLLETIRTLEEPKRMGQRQDRLFHAAREALANVNPGDLTALTAMRRQTRERIKAYIESSRNTAASTFQIETLMNNSGDGNVIIIKSTIKGSEVVAKVDKRIAESPQGELKDELKDELKNLADKISRLIDQLPDKAEKEIVARDLESLSQEALSKTPRRRWYELSGEGLIEAASKVAELAPAVAKAVASIRSILF